MLLNIIKNGDTMPFLVYCCIIENCSETLISRGRDTRWKHWPHACWTRYACCMLARYLNRNTCPARFPLTIIGSKTLGAVCQALGAVQEGATAALDTNCLAGGVVAVP